MTSAATYSYGAFRREALRCADALERLGVGRGEAVATMLPTGADAFVLQAACSYLGATIVPVSTLMRETRCLTCSTHRAQRPLSPFRTA